MLFLHFFDLFSNLVKNMKMAFMSETKSQAIQLINTLPLWTILLPSFISKSVLIKD